MTTTGLRAVFYDTNASESFRCLTASCRFGPTLWIGVTRTGQVLYVNNMVLNALPSNTFSFAVAYMIWMTLCTPLLCFNCKLCLGARLRCL